MRALGAVFIKELLENVREHRVLLSALFFGVLLAPLIFGASITMVSKRAVNSQDRPLSLTVSGAGHAPNLVNFLREQGTVITEAPHDEAQAVQAIQTGEHDLILLIEPDYAQALQTGEPAPLLLVMDTANNRAAAAGDRARLLLQAYGAQLSALRLLARGIDPAITQPMKVQLLDVATPAGRALLILGMMTYFCFMSLLVGGFYLAVDSTAGERERGSLEPLLSLPVSRATLVGGKMLATGVFMSLSLLLTLLAFVVVLHHIPLEALGMSANFGVPVALGIFALMLPFVPLGAGLMNAVAAFTRSNREAQTWLSMVMMLPLAPIIFAVFTETRPSMALMAVPSLGQHLLITSLMRGDEIAAEHIAVSALSTLAIGAVLVALAIRLYQREGLLGH